MLRTITYTLLGLGAAAVISAPIASADLTNTEVASTADAVALPAPRLCGGDLCAPYPSPPSGFKNGLHGSSQDMLDRVNAKKYGRLT